MDSLEFAKGSAESNWGSVRAAMGHRKRFPLKYVAIGNEDCQKEFYQGKVFNKLNNIYANYKERIFSSLTLAFN